MKKTLSSIFILLFVFLITFLIILSTIGLETKRFNNLISNKINQANTNIILNLDKIKFKFDIKEIKLFLQTNNPKIKYRDVIIPVKNVKVFIDFKSILTSEPKIEKVNLMLNQLDIKDVQKISQNFKPSNLNSFINNKVLEGNISSEINIFFENKNKIENFIVKGSVTNLKTKLIDELIFEKFNFDFFADKTDILVKNIFGETNFIKVSDGDLKIILSSEIELNGNFKSKINFQKDIDKKQFIHKNFKYLKNITNFHADLSNSFLIKFDKTYKIMNYEYKNSGKIKKGIFKFDRSIENLFSDNKINQLSFFDSETFSIFNPDKKITNLTGKYSLNNNKPANLKLINEIKKDFLNLIIDFEYSDLIILDLINYEKPNNKKAKINLNLKKSKNKVIIDELNYKEKNNLISLKDLRLHKNNLISFKDILIKTYKNGKVNNDFQIIFSNNIRIYGYQFDATNLSRYINRKSEVNKFSNISKEIEIDLKNVDVPLSKKLERFKLIGKIDRGKFTKITSKGSFGDNNFLDITMRSDKKNKKKYLEVYSDLTRPLLNEFNFFKGLIGGKLLFTSELSEKNSISKLNIENFKVVNAPGMVKLLSLADLRGLADLAEGEGISFDSLDIKMQKTSDFLKISEILALGPSLSVLMEGYQDKAVTSLRGTLVPAKTLNKMISKIPVIGDIVIPKEVGEGLFGISFRMKGPSGNIKTTIDPIKTITPRFIQKIVERKKKTK